MGRNDGHYHHHHQHYSHHRSSGYNRGSSSSSSSSSSAGRHSERSNQRLSSSSSSSNSSYNHPRLAEQEHSFESAHQQHQFQQQRHQIPPFAPPPPPLGFSPIFDPQIALQQMYFNQAQAHYVVPPDIMNSQAHLNDIHQQNLIQVQSQGSCQGQATVDSSWLQQSEINSSGKNITAPVHLTRVEPSNLAAAALDKLQLPANQITDKGIIPTIPYYELPAALMVPLIEPAQRKYKPINPKDLRLPLPKFPDENFLRSIDAYYGSDGKKRDNDGWDREFIDIWIKQKEAPAST